MDIKFILGAIVGMIIATFATYQFAYVKGKQDGKRVVMELYEKRVAKNRELRNKTDAEIDAMSDASICIYLGGLPDDCRK